MSEARSDTLRPSGAEPIAAGADDRVQFEFETTPRLEHDVRVVSFHGHEALGELFEFDIEVAGTHADFPLDDLLERRATLRIHHPPNTREVHGIVAGVEHDATRGHTVHTRFRVVPELWLLTQHHRSRIFQQRTTPQIVDAVLASNGAYRGRVEWRLAEGRAYQSREYCVQYRESDHAFISRLLEDEGIYYFFDHIDGVERLVFCDGNSWEDITGAPAVSYVEDVGMHAHREHISRLRFTASARSGASALRDYDPLQPRLDLQSTAAADRETAREHYDHPGDYVLRSEGRRRAEVRLQALRATRVQARGEGMVSRLVPGRIFTLAGHPRSEWDQRYAIWEVDHEAHARDVSEHEGGHEAGTDDPGAPAYRARFACTPATTPVRLVPSTPRPKVYGSHTATVVGPGGEEIYVDEHGRIKVQFWWDREGRSDENSSCWLRVAQSWAGGGWGALVIPRIGMEVVVNFLEGDPDRPLVTGCVYNGVNAPPNPLPAEKTRSTFRTNSSPGGGGFNELTFEDAAGSELIYLRAQKDHEEHVLHDHRTRIDHDQTHHVLHDQSERIDDVQNLSVGVDRHKDIGHDETIEVGANRTTHIGVDETFVIDANRSGRVGANETLVVGADRQRQVVANEAVAIGANQSVTIGASRNVHVVANDALSIDGAHTISVHGAQQTNVKGALSTTTHSHEARNVAAGRSTSIKRFDQTMVIGASATQVIGPYSVVALASLDLSVIRSKVSMKPQTITLSAPKGITLQCGKSVIKLEDGKITLDTGKGASVVLDGDKATVVGAPIKLN